MALNVALSPCIFASTHYRDGVAGLCVRLHAYLDRICTLQVRLTLSYGQDGEACSSVKQRHESDVGGDGDVEVMLPMTRM